jgi:hypothetical protein
MKDGYVNKCKECVKKRIRTYYRLNSEKILAKDRIRHRSNEHRERCKKYALRNAEKVNKIKYQWRKRNPEKSKAHRAVYQAIKKGVLKKQPCEFCGKMQSQAHHDDYANPLLVRWVCSRHHADLHLKN